MITWLQLEYTWNVFIVCFMWLKQTQTTILITSPGDSHLGNEPTDHMRRTPTWRIWRNETCPAGWLLKKVFDLYFIWSSWTVQQWPSSEKSSWSKSLPVARCNEEWSSPRTPNTPQGLCMEINRGPSPNQPQHISLVESVPLLSPFWRGEQRHNEVS